MQPLSVDEAYIELPAGSDGLKVGNDLREEIKRSYTAAFKKHGSNWDEIKQDMRDDIGQFLSQNTGRNPLVIPVITTV